MLIGIGFDQSLTATGWSVVRLPASSTERPELIDKGTIVTEPAEGVKGFYDTIPRCDAIARAVHDIMLSHPEVTVVVHEMPAVPGQGQTHAGRTDASLMTCIAVRTTCHILDRRMPIVMISANAAKRTMTGLATATKAEVKAAVLKVLGTDVRMNTNVSDSIAALLAAQSRGLIAKEFQKMKEDMWAAP